MDLRGLRRSFPRAFRDYVRRGVGEALLPHAPRLGTVQPETSISVAAPESPNGGKLGVSIEAGVVLDTCLAEDWQLFLGI